tara:strand:+ start:285 stop:860 length:576 start_codon:yes stop_codon:yes gene_type:complete
MRNIYLSFFLFFLLVINIRAEEVILEIESHWNEINSMSGRFIQTDSDENILEGNFYFLKPYQSKFDYDNGNETVITNKSLLRIVDKEGYQINSYAIGNNIIKKLLSNEFKLIEEFNIIDIVTLKKNYKLMMTFKNDDLENKFLLYFNRDSFDLEKWEIYDEFDNKTVLEFTNIKKNIFISQNLFAVKYKNK